MKKVSQKIKFWREQRNYTQEYLAQELGISQEHYSRLEAGQGDIKLSRLEKIAELLDVPLYELFDSSEKVIIKQQYNKQNGVGVIMHQQNMNDTPLYEQTIQSLQKTIDTQDRLIQHQQKTIEHYEKQQDTP